MSLQYPLVELVSGVVFVVFWHQPFFLLVLLVLLVIAIIDLQHLVIPDGLLIVLAVVAVIHEQSVQFLFTGLIASGFFFILWFASKGRWIGFGDVKLAGVLGLLFGFPATLMIIYLAVMLGGFLGVVLILLKRATMKTALPFGTLLAVGTMLFILFRNPLYEILSRF